MRKIVDKEATEQYMTKVAPIIEKKCSRILPSPFWIEPKCDLTEEIRDANGRLPIDESNKYIYQYPFNKNWTIVGNNLFNKMCKFGRYANALLALIIRDLPLECNYIVISDKYFEKETCNSRIYFKAAVEILIKNKIIIDTNRRDLYIINHYMFIKGRFFDFIANYYTMYKDYEFEYTYDGKLIIDD